MKQSVVLIGLPGSGKTTWISKNINNFDFVFDDFSIDKNFFEKLKTINDGTVCLSDPTLCDASKLKKLVDFLNDNNWTHSLIYWENNADKAWANILNRNDGRKITKQWLLSLSKKYIAPSDSLAIFQ